MVRVRLSIKIGFFKGSKKGFVSGYTILFKKSRILETFYENV